VSKAFYPLVKDAANAYDNSYPHYPRITLRGLQSLAQAMAAALALLGARIAGKNDRFNPSIALPLPKVRSKYGVKCILSPVYQHFMENRISGNKIQKRVELCGLYGSCVANSK
jgi:hypothetical protein